MDERQILEAKFYSIFTGHNDFYVKHVPPFRADAEGKVKGRYTGFAFEKDANDHKTFLKLTKEKYIEHLRGGDGLAVSPITNYTDDKGKVHKNVCFFSAIDVDVKLNFVWIIERLERYGFKFAAFVSKSHGLHIVFFYATPEKASEVVDTMDRIITIFGMQKMFLGKKGEGKVEIFPKQKVLKSDDDKGNALMLPYYNAAKDKQQRLLTKNGKLLKLSSAIDYIESMFTSVAEINETIKKLPYSDAPYCVQALLLNGSLGESSGRNNFMFTVAVYLKKKFGTEFKDELVEANKLLGVPLSDKDVDGIFRSVSEKEYGMKCKEPPCSTYCDKKLCKQREFTCGKKGKNNYFTGADSWGMISRVLAEMPYYLWEVRIDAEDEYKTIRLDSEADILNQYAVKKACLQKLNWAPVTVKEDVWIDIINGAMKGIEDRQIEIEKETDTTELSLLHNRLLRYLTHRQVQNTQAYMIPLGQVYKEGNTYYFSHEGFQKYLQIDKFNLGRTNLREVLLSYGCVSGEVTYETKKGPKTISCWKKESDEELEKMTDYYDDVYDGDEEAIDAIKLDKRENKTERVELADGDEILF